MRFREAAPPYPPAPRSTAGRRRAPARLRRPSARSAPQHGSLPGLYRAAIDALADLPVRGAGDGRARPRPGGARAGAGQRARRALGAAGRPHAARRGDGLPRRLGHRDHGPRRRRADGRRAAVRRPALERRARGRARRGDRADGGPRGGRRAARGGRAAHRRPRLPRRAPSGSPPRCARCRRSTRRSASCAGCSIERGSPHDASSAARYRHGAHAPRQAPRPRGRRLAPRVRGARRRGAGDRRRRRGHRSRPRRHRRGGDRGRRRGGPRARARASSTRCTSRPAWSPRRPTRTGGARSSTSCPTGQRLYPVGRLDADTTGLILLTNDGDLAYALTHPRFEVPRTYRARVDGRPSERALRALREGVELDDGRTAPAQRAPASARTSSS